MRYRIRRARRGESAVLGDIERSAARLFVAAGMTDVAEDEPASVEFIEAVARSGAVFVAATADRDRPVGFALVSFLDHAAHLHELSVAENHGRRGLGRRLIAAVCRFAVGAGRNAVTLSTFRDVPWNGPYYERLGFHHLRRDEWTPALLMLHHREAELGLDVGRRGFMRKDLESPAIGRRLGKTGRIPS